MSLILAHHIEMYHIPILTFIFVAGFWLGWQQVGPWILRRLRGSAPEPAPKA